MYERRAEEFPRQSHRSSTASSYLMRVSSFNCPIRTSAQCHQCTVRSSSRVTLSSSASCRKWRTFATAAAATVRLSSLGSRIERLRTAYRECHTMGLMRCHASLGLALEIGGLDRKLTPNYSITPSIYCNSRIWPAGGRRVLMSRA